MEDIVGNAKAEFTRAQNRLLHTLEAVPADKLNWSPSDTARTPLALAAHAALGTQGIAGLLAGKPFPFKDMKEMDTVSRQTEKGYTTLESVVELVSSTGASYLAWMDSLTPDQVVSTVNFPMGSFPLAFAMTFPADHLRCHAAQLEYVQTIWGDYENHM